MQTRQQSTRQHDARSRPAAAENRMATRSMRQAAAPDALAVAPQRGGPAKARTMSTKPGSLVKDPAPRRGAPSGQDVSVANIGEGSEDEGDEDEDDEDEDENHDGGEPDGPRHSPSGGPGSGDKDEEEMQQALTVLLPELERAANALENQLIRQGPDAKPFRVLLKAKREALTIHRYYFQEAGTKSILIDWNKPGALCNFVHTNKPAINTLARANLVATLDYIQHVESKSDTDKRDFLQTLDASFPDLFQPLDLNEPCPELVLEIRTCYLIEMLASVKGKPRAPEAIARIFCQAEGGFDYASLCENGPYRRLGGGDEEDRQRCAAQVERLLGTITRARKNLGLETLREEFPLSKLWGRLVGWITALCDRFREFENSEYLPGDQDDTESVEDETEELVCHHDDAAAQQPFPIDKSTIQELEATKTRDSANRPADDRHVSSGGLPAAGSHRCGSKRPYKDVADDREGQEADGEGEPDFQQDERQLVHKPKNPTLEPWPTRVKTRHRVVGESRFPAAATAEPLVHRPGRSSALDEPILVPLRGQYTRRTAWTEHDAEVLVKLVGETKAFYAGIEHDYQDCFDYPRLQQAYRDKARNLKVDFLIADERLPPEFDRVSLGPKEVRKLKSAGRNPYREEKDVDAQGRPTNTLWLE